MKRRHNSKTARSILVADADAGCAKALASHFQRQGFQVHQTARGDDALWLARFHQPDLAVVDLALEEMSGYELVARLNRISKKLPVIITASDQLGASEVEARQVGIVYYAPKPVDLLRLDAVVNRAIHYAGRRPRRPAARPDHGSRGGEIQSA